VRFSNFIQPDPLGYARLDGATRQESEQALEVLYELCRMLQSHRIDGVEEGSPAAR
jgi:hypothetical protein